MKRRRSKNTKFWLNVTRTGIFATGKDVRELVNKRLEDLVTPAVLDSAAAFLRQIILDQFGVSPQPDFDALDNPYSVRGGTIRYAPPSGGSPHFRGDRRVLVHVDDANVRGAIYSVVYPRSNTVGVGLEPTEEVLWVIDGTDVMLPRDTIGETFRDEGIRRAILKHVAGTMRLKR